MKKEQPTDNRQLSLPLDFTPQDSPAVSAAVVFAEQRTASIIPFPTRQPQGLSFRERVIQDLMRTCVVSVD